MRRTLLSALLTASLLAPVAQAEDLLVFSDSFDRADEIPIISWFLIGSDDGGPAEDFYYGVNSVAVVEGQALFHYGILDDGPDTGSEADNTWFHAASIFNLFSFPPSEGPEATITAMFEFTPDDAQFDYVATFGPPLEPCSAFINRFDYRGQPIAVPCDGFGIRLTSAGADGPAKPVSKRSLTAGDPDEAGITRLAPVPTGAPVVLEIGGFFSDGDGPFPTYWSALNGTFSETNLVPGHTYLVTVNFSFLGDFTASITDGDTLIATVDGSMGCGRCKSTGSPDTRAKVQAAVQRLMSGKRDTAGTPWITTRTEEPPGALLAFSDAGLGNLRTLDGLGLRANVAHRFDNIALYLTAATEPEPLYTITAEVEAKGKFKKQPIDVRKKGVLQATVYGDNSGEDALDVQDIRLESVTFGATGSETTTPALEVRYAHVDKDGVLDAIFDFAKSAAITPCGTTSVTITGDFNVEGGFARFSGADNRVKVTGCPRTK